VFFFVHSLILFGISKEEHVYDSTWISSAIMGGSLNFPAGPRLQYEPAIACRDVRRDPPADGAEEPEGDEEGGGGGAGGAREREERGSGELRERGISWPPPTEPRGRRTKSKQSCHF